MRTLLIDGQLEMGHARALLALPPEQRTMLAQKIIEKKLTVRDTERLVQLNKQPKMRKAVPYANESRCLGKKTIP